MQARPRPRPHPRPHLRDLGRPARREDSAWRRRKRRQEEPEAQHDPLAGHSPPAILNAMPHVLLVDDEAPTRNALARFVTRKGHTVSQADSAAEAVAVL